MKDKLFIFLTFVILSSPAAAQTGKIDLDIKDVPIKELLSIVEAQSPYSVSYRDVQLPDSPTISISGKDISIKELLTTELSRFNLVYTLVGDKIVVTPAPPRQVRADSGRFKVSGKITDTREDAVIGASVMIKGTSNGVITDIEGRYSIEVEKGQVLSVACLGYTSQDLKVTRATMDVVLEEDTEMINEAVAIGYGTTLRKNLTTSVATVKAADINRVSNSNVSQLLMGKAAGLRATISSAQPGGNVDISIRGGGTPIYIVDGIMMPSGSLEVGRGTIETPNSINRSGLAGLNPGDIESIEVLKDASASIYGINAANGVILITTKKGAETSPRVSLETNFSVVTNYKYMEPLNSQEYMNFANVFSKEIYLYNHRMAPYGSAEYDGNWSPEYTPYDIANAKTTNWLDYVMRTGSIQNHSVTISGGSKYVKYYLGGNFFDQTGTVINSRMKRYTLRSNLSAQVFPFLKLNSILNINSNEYTNSNADGGGAGGIGKDALQTALMFPPTYTVTDAEGKIMRYRNSIANPSEMANFKDMTNSTGWYVNFSADLNIWKDILKMRAVYGYNRETAKRSLYIPTDMMYYEIVGVSRGHLGDAQRNDQTVEVMLTYKQKFGNIVDLDAVLGFGWYKTSGNTLELDYKNANDLIGPDSVGGAAGPFYPTSSKYENEKRSQFGRVSADFLDRYVIAATLRRDGTDKFFPGKKYAWFPSVSLAWKISNEPVMKNVSWINLLKLRGSYGVTGRDNLGTSLYGLYELATNYVYFDNNNTVFIPYMKSGADYPDVTWEKTIMKNIGLDFHILGDRIWGSIDFFRNDVTDLLGVAPGEPLNMVGSRPVNYGHYYRHGWDAVINSLNIKTADGFKWTSQLTLTRYGMYWVKRAENYDYAEYQIRENEPMNANYYYKVTGIINADRSNMPESQKTLPEEAQMPGYAIIDDKNKDGMITMEDIYMEDVLPKISIGFGNTFRYKNFDLDIFFYGQFGATKYNYALQWASAAQFSYTTPQNSNQYAYRLWNSQNNTSGDLPGIASVKGVSLPGNAGTDLRRQDASFVRVRNITLGYNINGAILGSVLSKRVENIRVYFDTQNPLTFTTFAGVDPEIYTGNSSSPAGYPMSRTFSLGLKFNFK